MKWIPETATLELTARNVTALADKLDDPSSARTLGSPCRQVMARSVEDGDRTPDQAAAARAEGVIVLTRSELSTLATAGATVTVAGTTIVSVPDAAHYSGRAPGLVFMPSTGEVR